jgi:aminoglycoside 3-N-acetyltransferase
MERHDWVDENQIHQGLERLGVTAGDLLLVHSSLRSFGHVEGGADTVIDALLDAVGSHGTVLMPTLTFGVMKNSPVRFSVKSTPSSSGRITEVFRLRREAVRSCHPVSSAAAIGAQAELLTNGHSDTPCDASSPYYRMMDLGGKVIFFGASLGSNTLFHCAEDIVQPEYLGYAEIRDSLVTLSDGSVKTVTARRYDCTDRGVKRYLENMESVLLGEGILKKAQIGNSRTYLVDARENVESSCRVLRERPEFILKEVT